MKICIVGAGAIGGFLAVKLANSGHVVSVVARGDHLKAIKRDGLKLRINGIEEKAAVIASTDVPKDPQDYVFVTVKEPAMKTLYQQVKLKVLVLMYCQLMRHREALISLC